MTPTEAASSLVLRLFLVCAADGPNVMGMWCAGVGWLPQGDGSCRCARGAHVVSAPQLEAAKRRGGDSIVSRLWTCVVSVR